MATTWDPNNKSASIALSGGNLIATASNTSGSASVRATRVVTGPTYLEYTIGSLTGDTLLVGMVDYSFNLSSTALGADTHGLSYQSSGAVKINGTTLSTIQTFAASNVVQMFFSPKLQQVWFNVNNSANWNNSSSNVPSDVYGTAVGGISTATLATGGGGPLFPAMSSTGAASNTNAVTAAFSSAGWTYSAPSGGASVDAVGVAATDNQFANNKPQLDGPVRHDTVTTNVQRMFYGTAAGAWFSFSANTPNTWVKFWSPAATATHVSGFVYENGLPVKKIVRLYDHNTGDFLGETTSAADGSYSIPGLGRTNVVAIAFDPTTFNAICWDQVTPV